MHRCFQGETFEKVSPGPPSKALALASAWFFVETFSVSREAVTPGISFAKWSPEEAGRLKELFSQSEKTELTGSQPAQENPRVPRLMSKAEQTIILA